MKRYKLVRIVKGRYVSANTWGQQQREYKIGEVTEIADWGVACYKRFTDAFKLHHIRETMRHFNKGKPIAVLEVQPIGKARRMRDYYLGYGKGAIYEGGINYPAIRVIGLVKKITDYREPLDDSKH